MIVDWTHFQISSAGVRAKGDRALRKHIRSVNSILVDHD